MARLTLVPQVITAYGVKLTYVTALATNGVAVPIDYPGYIAARNLTASPITLTFTTPGTVFNAGVPDQSIVVPANTIVEITGYNNEIYRQGNWGAPAYCYVNLSADIDLALIAITAPWRSVGSA